MSDSDYQMSTSGYNPSKPDANKPRYPNAQSSRGEMVARLKARLSSMVSNFTTSNLKAGYTRVSDFLTSNRVVDRVIFIFLLLVLLIISLNAITALTYPSLDVKGDVTLLKGSVDAQYAITIPQNSVTHPELFVTHSTNRIGGLEFTWSVWIYVNDMPDTTSYKNVFFKGMSIDGALCNNVNNLLNGPGMYLMLDSVTNSTALYVIMDTYTNPGNYYASSGCIKHNLIKIPHIPVREWVHVCMVCQERNMGIYINGLVASTILLDGVPKQNNGDVNIGYNGGFNGRISALRYINTKLGVLEITNIFKSGPIITDVTPLNKPTATVNWDPMSFRWYTA